MKPRVADWEQASGMPGEGLSRPGVGHAEDPVGRAIGATRSGLHLQRHPEPVEDCFGCKVMTQSVALSAHASARGDGINRASALKEEHQAIARSDPERYAPANSRWI
jgi:hypothetical protein